jgi:LPXTG-motif cell wall-anchored protein
MILNRIRWLLAMTAVMVVAGVFGPAPADATTTEPSGSPTGQVVYAIAYRDNCDRSVSVAMANATPESVPFHVNGKDDSVEPMGVVEVTVSAAKQGKTVVHVKVKKGKGKPDHADHTWSWPKLCASPSASAPPSSAPPSATPTSTAPAGVVPDDDDQTKLPLTGVPAGKIALTALGLIVIGGAVYLIGRPLRRLRRQAA